LNYLLKKNLKKLIEGIGILHGCGMDGTDNKFAILVYKEVERDNMDEELEFAIDETQRQIHELFTIKE
jgi:hypothetical protein